jgi:hypothetical protein
MIQRRAKRYWARSISLASCPPISSTNTKRRRKRRYRRCRRISSASGGQAKKRAVEILIEQRGDKAPQDLTREHAVTYPGPTRADALRIIDFAMGGGQRRLAMSVNRGKSEVAYWRASWLGAGCLLAIADMQTNLAKKARSTFE